MKRLPRHHPLWLVLQQTLSLLGIAMWLYAVSRRGFSGDGTDLAGGSLLVKELIHLLKARAE